MSATYQTLIGDCKKTLSTLPEKSVNCCVTSPPYFGLRDYGVAGQMGLESTPDLFVSALVEVFREVRRVLRDDGVLWLNLGDTWVKKQLIGVPWRVAFALQSDGWFLRQDIIWSKPNQMPENVPDRCTRAHEYIFMLSKSPRYWFDKAAMQEPAAQPERVRRDRFGGKKYDASNTMHSDGSIFTGSATRNRRSVWSVTTKPFRGAHFATFPPDLIEPCILAGCPVGGVVLDPFGGSGTTAGVALAHGRSAILCELNPEYAALVPQRVASIVAKYEAGRPANDNVRLPVVVGGDA